MVHQADDMTPDGAHTTSRVGHRSTTAGGNPTDWGQTNPHAHGLMHALQATAASLKFQPRRQARGPLLSRSKWTAAPLRRRDGPSVFRCTPCQTVAQQAESLSGLRVCFAAVDCRLWTRLVQVVRSAPDPLPTPLHPLALFVTEWKSMICAEDNLYALAGPSETQSTDVRCHFDLVRVLMTRFLDPLEPWQKPT
ncbi:hypothetical protein BO71DRAFT_430967 [Aspergillus ellipticus CBS 707.79]|uniref:Uncharacterized protein n=1 Tax=Aspergillus ellipticus CBS 707.79 TaxID=1448320 RepID=A0A319D8C6_9EURO|nr:hypothetical protein BO71DRAFT_430967 [Aspergillus ellipticus CBS 707.79]